MSAEDQLRTINPAFAGDLVLTGERTLPEIPDENYWFRRHEAAYRALAPWVTGARVLEAGCGEGYGADLLRLAGASHVLAFDNDTASADHASRRYPGVHVLSGNLDAIPLASDSVEVISHLQTIEHLSDQAGVLAELARVLRPAGTLLLSTPNRLTFSPGRDRPLNPFHTRELSAPELLDLLAPHFHVTRLLGLRHGRRLRRLEAKIGPLVDAQVYRASADWSAPVRTAVHSVRANDFDVVAGDLEDCLDLVVVAWRRT